MGTPNKMCIDCNQYGTTCNGSANQIYTGCIYKGTATPPVSLGELSDIYTEAVAILPAEDIDHHETDLYLRVTDASRGLINRYKYKGSVSTFIDQIDRVLWYDIPFAYTPTWTEHHNRNTPPERPSFDWKPIADELATQELNKSIKGLWSNLQFEHADAAGWWYTYTLQGQGRQTIRINIPGDVVARYTGKEQ